MTPEERAEAVDFKFYGEEFDRAGVRLQIAASIREAVAAERAAALAFATSLAEPVTADRESPDYDYQRGWLAACQDIRSEIQARGV